MDLETIIRECWQDSEDHGWHEGVDDRTFVEKLMLIVSELAEALEEYRDGHGWTEVYYNDAKPDKPEGIPIELADAFIRLADLAVIYGIDLVEAIETKMAYNKTREYRHGGKKA